MLFQPLLHFRLKIKIKNIIFKQLLFFRVKTLKMYIILWAWLPNQNLFSVHLYGGASLLATIPQKFGKYSISYLIDRFPCVLSKRSPAVKIFITVSTIHLHTFIALLEKDFRRYVTIMLIGFMLLFLRCTFSCTFLIFRRVPKQQDSNASKL